MKNTLLNLNTINAFTNGDLLRNNIVNVKLNNSDDIISINLSSSELKLFLRYYKFL
jgi:hypothetical protein